jgi:flagellum-specific ATP synthase
MPFKSLKEKLASKSSYSVSFGEIIKINATVITAMGLRVSIGDMVKIISNDTAQESMGMVTEIDGKTFFITPFSFVEGFCSGDKVFLDSVGMNIPVSLSLLGRVVDPFMNPIDDKGEIKNAKLSPIIKAPIAALKRGMIDEVFSVGVKSIDGLLTCGKGQKLGIFAGSGVGKSTLMGMIVKGSQAPIKVIALKEEGGYPFEVGGSPSARPISR